MDEKKILIANVLSRKTKEDTAIADANHKWPVLHVPLLDQLPRSILSNILSFLPLEQLITLSAENKLLWRLIYAESARVGKLLEEQITTRFFEAIAEGNEEEVIFWLDAGFNPNACDKLGVGALQRACFFEKFDIAKQLIIRGANVRVENRQKQTPLHIAAQEGQEKIARLLVEKGAVVDARDAHEMTPFHHALVRKKGESTAKFLLSVGADPYAVTRERNTALHIVAHKKKGHPSMVKFLVQFGLNPLATNHKGKTPRKVVKNPTTLELLKTAEENAKFAAAQEKDDKFPFWASTAETKAWDNVNTTPTVEQPERPYHF
jgi:ankyrin repeat protein